ncbi:hypothetical protein JHK85_012917 [Glycine max]|nr:hypothetical protein JHK85_012917 [Glycine max]
MKTKAHSKIIDNMVSETEQEAPYQNDEFVGLQKVLEVDPDIINESVVDVDGGEEEIDVDLLKRLDLVEPDKDECILSFCSDDVKSAAPLELSHLMSALSLVYDQENWTHSYPNKKLASNCFMHFEAEALEHTKKRDTGHQSVSLDNKTGDSTVLKIGNLAKVVIKQDMKGRRHKYGFNNNKREKAEKKRVVDDETGDKHQLHEVLRMPCTCGYLRGEAQEHVVDAIGDVGPELRRKEVARHRVDHHCGGGHRGRRREHRLCGGQLDFVAEEVKKDILIFQKISSGSF